MLAARPVDVVREILPELAGPPLYVTIDVDVLDPGEAPGTGSPEPGGIRVAELLESSTCSGDATSSAATWSRWRTPGIQRPHGHRRLLGDPRGAARMVGYIK